MSKKIFLKHSETPDDYICHYNHNHDPRNGQFTFSFDLLDEIDKMKKSGLYKNDTEIARALGYSSGELRSIKTNLVAEKYAADAARAIELKEQGMSYVAIGKELGYSDKKIAKMIEEPKRESDKKLVATANVLEESLKKNKYIDVGEGVERMLGVPRTQLDAAIKRLQMEGKYEVKNLQIQQINAPIGQKTSLLVLAPVGTQTKDIYKNLDDVHLVNEYHSDDFGKTYQTFQKPTALDSSRIQINYADEKGYQPKDGVIELRPGVADIALGQSRYAQVRINVDDKYYLKGMAIYSNDLPKGIDVRFNTNKEAGTPMEKVFKPLKREGVLPNGDPDPNSPVDWKNPFGATIKANTSETAGGQIWYTDKNGEKKLSVINKVNEEGDWGEWDRTLSSQFLSKQPHDFIKTQLNTTYLQKKAELEDIRSISNSEIRKKMLYSFADDCDASAVELKAAARPRQATQVLLPLESVKEKEIYAPNFKDGEWVAVIRYPHSGPSEILDLKVNNKNPEAIKIFGKTAKDCVVINPKNAAKLSGADFDGDTGIVIPNPRKANGKGIIEVKDTLKLLRDYDPHIAYKGYEGMKVMKEKNKGTEMGKAANLITDMTLIGCTDDELARAIRYSMVVIDAPKHKLDWKRAYKEEGIADLKKKYQGGANAGAATMISRAKGRADVPVRKLYTKIDPETGKKIFTEDTRNATYTKTYTLKDGTVKVKEMPRTTRSTKMAEAENAFNIASNPNHPYPVEIFYGTYANKMKEMANDIRLEASKIKTYEVNPSAKEAYAKEIDSINDKLNTAKMNAPYERQSQMAATVILKQKKAANPEMSDSEKKKQGQLALNNARARNIPGGKKQRIELTQRELEAINNNAIPASHLRDILNNANQDKLKEAVMPTKSVKGLTPAKIAWAKSLLAGENPAATQADVAEMLGISPTTLRKYLNS